MQLTDASIKALKTKATRYLVSDGEGLSLDVLPSGKMSWFFRYRQPGGKQEKVTLGQYPAMTLKVARNARKQMGGKVAAGESPAQETKARRAGVATNPTVFQFGER